MATSLLTTGVEIGGKHITALAWVKISSAGTPSVEDSYNVSSITDNGTGQYALNFSSALTNGTYAVAGCHTSPGGYGASFASDHWGANTTARCTVSTFNATNYTDPAKVFTIIFGD